MFEIKSYIFRPNVKIDSWSRLIFEPDKYFFDLNRSEDVKQIPKNEVVYHGAIHVRYLTHTILGNTDIIDMLWIQILNLIDDTLEHGKGKVTSPGQNICYEMELESEEKIRFSVLSSHATVQQEWIVPKKTFLMELVEGAKHFFVTLQQNKIMRIDQEIMDYIGTLENKVVSLINTKQPIMPTEKKRQNEKDMILTSYDPVWNTIYEREKESILKSIGRIVSEVQHVGSTSIPGMLSRPIVDVAIGLDSLEMILGDSLNYLMETYYRMPNVFEYPRMMTFRNSPLQPYGIQLFVTEVNSDAWNNLVYFRHHLTHSSELAQAYADLKKKWIWEQNLCQEEYAKEKSIFIHQVLGNNSP